MTVASFWVAGDPKAQPRHRAFARGGNVRCYDPGTAEGWKALIAAAARPHLPIVPLKGPVEVHIDFFFRRPKRLLRKRDPDRVMWYDRKPDRDNLAKAVLDALTQIGFWFDDAQVCSGRVRKFYCAKLSVLRWSRPGARISILSLANSEALP